MAHHTAHIFLDLALILLFARVLGTIAVRYHVPAVLGELAAGFLLGPSVLGWVEVGDIFKVLAALGVTLLLFEVGLETDLPRLLKTGRISALVAIAGLAVPFVLGFLAAYAAFGLPLLVALFIAGTLTATSTAITVRMLSELGEQKTDTGQMVLGAVLIDDILGVFLLILLYDFALNGVISWSSAGSMLLFTVFFLIIAPFVTRLALGFVGHMERTGNVPGLVPTTVVAIALLFAAIAQLVGVPEIIGGFAAGLAISRRFVLPIASMPKFDEEFADRIETEIKPIINLFTPIFFAVVGLSIDVTKLDLASPFIWLFMAVFVVVATIGKLACGVPCKASWPRRAMVGAVMVPRGEVGLIFAGIGLSAGILAGDVYTALIVVIAATTLIPPLFVPWINRQLREAEDAGGDSLSKRCRG